MLWDIATGFIDAIFRAVLTSCFRADKRLSLSMAASGTVIDASTAKSGLRHGPSSGRRSWRATRHETFEITGSAQRASSTWMAGSDCVGMPDTEAYGDDRADRPIP